MSSATIRAACINFGPPHYANPPHRAVELWDRAAAHGVSKVYAAELHDDQIAGLLRDRKHLRIVKADANAYRNGRGQLVGRHARTALIYDPQQGWVVHDETQIVIHSPVRKLHLPVGLAQWEPNDARDLDVGIHLLSGPSLRHHLVRAANVRTIRREVMGLRRVVTYTGSRVWVPASLGGDWNDTQLPTGLHQVGYHIDRVAVLGEMQVHAIEGLTADRDHRDPLDTQRDRLHDHPLVIVEQVLHAQAARTRTANKLYRAA